MKMANRKGFTMVELLIVLAIIAILAAVAIPVYSSQLENARKEVDNSNLRAATGLAAQDYILREAGSTGKSGSVGTYYVVLTYEKAANGAVNSSNMLVYPAKGYVKTADGTWSEQNTSGTFALPVVNNGTSKPSEVNSATINGQKVKLMPLQQNSGKAYFVIQIGNGGVVLTSEIKTYT